MFAFKCKLETKSSFSNGLLWALMVPWSGAECMVYCGLMKIFFSVFQIIFFFYEAIILHLNDM